MYGCFFTLHPNTLTTTDMKTKLILLVTFLSVSLMAFSQDSYELNGRKNGYITEFVQNKTEDYSCTVELSMENMKFSFGYNGLLTDESNEDWVDQMCDVTFKTNKGESFRYSTIVKEDVGLGSLFGCHEYRIIIPASSMIDKAKELAVFFRGNLTEVSIKRQKDGKERKIQQFNVNTRKLLPKMIADMQDKLHYKIDDKFLRDLGITHSAGDAGRWLIPICKESPNLMPDITHPESTHITSKIIQWAQDSMMKEPEGYFTMYYTRAAGTSDRDAVTDIYFVPEDYEPVMQNGKEITCPPKVKYFTLHTRDNIFGAWVEEITMNGGHLYKHEYEILLNEVFGDRVFFLLTDETRYHPNPSLSCKGHLVESLTKKNPIWTKIR